MSRRGNHPLAVTARHHPDCRWLLIQIDAPHQKAPAEGGPTYDRLSVASRTALDAVRLTVSRELGHNRLDVTDAYLGRRWGGGKVGA